MKILAVSDNYITPEHFKVGLSKLLQKNELGIIKLDRDRKSRVKTASEESIREYIGSPEQIVEEVGDAEALLVNYAPVTAEVIKAGEKLKFIGCTRGGPVNIDISAATSRRIPVANAPERSLNPVAEFTIGLMIVEARNIARAHHALMNGDEFHVNPRIYSDAAVVGVELANKTLGIIGLGHIGSKVAQLAKAFGMNIVAYDPYIPRERGEEFNVTLMDLDTLLKTSDFISIHVRLTPETKKMIGLKELKLMKKTAYLINTSRGAVVDEKALYEALSSRLIAGAALDVFEKEPVDRSNPLLSLSNITVTPHMAGISQEVPLRSVALIAEELRLYLEGVRPKHILNPSSLEKV